MHARLAGWMDAKQQLLRFRPGLQSWLRLCCFLCVTYRLLADHVPAVTVMAAYNVCKYWCQSKQQTVWVRSVCQ
jgi:hypothetical protein